MSDFSQWWSKYRKWVYMGAAGFVLIFVMALTFGEPIDQASSATPTTTSKSSKAPSGKGGNSQTDQTTNSRTGQVAASASAGSNQEIFELFLGISLTACVVAYMIHGGRPLILRGPLQTF